MKQHILIKYMKRYNHWDSDMRKPVLHKILHGKQPPSTHNVT